MKTFVLISILVASAVAQRSPFAGDKPIGYPVIETSTSVFANRFGDDEETTTVKLPIEALGDAALVTRLSKLPIDQQPFWLINWRALQANRENPQTYEQRRNVFVDNVKRVKRGLHKRH